MTPLRPVYCASCSAHCGDVPDGSLRGGARVLCHACDQKRLATEQAIRRIKAKPELLRLALASVR